MIKRLYVTGYKAHELGIFNHKHPGIAIIKKAIKRQLVQLLDEELEWVIIGGQYGVEMWTAEVVLELQENYPQLKLAILAPFLDHYKNWNEIKQEQYEMIASLADYVNVISNRPYEGPWQFKASNQFLIDHTDALLIIYDEEKEESPKYIFHEAKQKYEQGEYHFIQITAYDLQMIAEEERYEM